MTPRAFLRLAISRARTSIYLRLLNLRLWLMLHLAYRQIRKGELFMIDQTSSIEPTGTTEIKPGLKTSEFYMPHILALLGAAVTFGLLTTPLADNLAGAIAAAVPAVAGLLGAAQAAATYIKGRVSLKTAVALKK